MPAHQLTESRPIPRTGARDQRIVIALGRVGGIHGDVSLLPGPTPPTPFEFPRVIGTARRSSTASFACWAFSAPEATRRRMTDST
ncbi:MAG: hypothetical protein H6514_20300 [Acidimicrobiaceae bacterium]|nr:hypothetical protein [Acidimicrobiaceae bacterium]